MQNLRAPPLYPPLGIKCNQGKKRILMLVKFFFIFNNFRYVIGLLNDMCLLILNPGLFYIASTFLVIGVKLPYQPVCPYVCRSVGWPVGWSVGWFFGWSVFPSHASIGAPVYSCPILDGYISASY